MLVLVLASGAVSTKITWEEDRFTDVLRSSQLHQNPLNAESPTRMGRDTMAESSDVEFEFFWVEVHCSEVLDEHVNAVFSLAARGHFVPAKVEVKSTGELFSGTSNFSVDLMDVEGLERHGPAWKEVELRQVFGQQVGILSVNVVAPLNGAAFFLDDADGVVVFDPRERQLWNDDFHRFFTLLCSVGVDGGNERLRFLFFSH